MRHWWLYITINSLTIFKWKMRNLRLDLIYLSFFVQYMFYLLRPILLPNLSLFFRTMLFKYPSVLSRFCFIGICMQWSIRKLWQVFSNVCHSSRDGKNTLFVALALAHVLGMKYNVFGCIRKFHTIQGKSERHNAKSYCVMTFWATSYLRSPFALFKVKKYKR